MTTTQSERDWYQFSVSPPELLLASALLDLLPQFAVHSLCVEAAAGLNELVVIIIIICSAAE